MINGPANRSSKVGKAWFLAYPVLVVLLYGIVTLKAPDNVVVDLRILGSGIPSEVLSGQRVTAFGLIGFPSDLRRGWVRLEACPKTDGEGECYRWPIISMTPNRNGVWAGELGHIGINRPGDYRMTVRVYADMGLDAPLATDVMDLRLRVLTKGVESELEGANTRARDAQVGRIKCDYEINGWRGSGPDMDSIHNGVVAWDTVSKLDSNGMLYACPAEDGILSFTLKGSAVWGRGAHVIVQVGGHTVFEELVDQVPEQLSFEVSANTPIMLAFVNDMYRPPADRTLWISDALYTPVSASH